MGFWLKKTKSYILPAYNLVRVNYSHSMRRDSGITKSRSDIHLVKQFMNNTNGFWWYVLALLWDVDISESYWSGKIRRKKWVRIVFILLCVWCCSHAGKRLDVRLFIMISTSSVLNLQCVKYNLQITKLIKTNCQNFI